MPPRRFVSPILWKEDEIVAQFQEFMRDNWNHPSVAIWDASNETHWAFLKDKVIPAVRGLDISNRPWENGYNLRKGLTIPTSGTRTCSSPTGRDEAAVL